MLHGPTLRTSGLGATENACLRHFYSRKLWQPQWYELHAGYFSMNGRTEKQLKYVCKQTLNTRTFPCKYCHILWT